MKTYILKVIYPTARKKVLKIPFVKVILVITGRYVV